MYKNNMVTRLYSEGFKIKALAELSTGNYTKKLFTESIVLPSMNGLKSTTAKT